jgi:IclR family transcriptional regulator, pca regulon regulatory protein
VPPRTAAISSGDPPKTGAETARKVLQVLMQFDRRRPSATVRELAEASGLSLPTTHRYVALLRELGFLEESERASYYQLGWRVFQLAQAARSARGLVQVSEPIMARLSATTGETVTLLQLVDRSMECIAQVEAEHMLRISLLPGRRLPLTAGASARVLLSQVAPDQRRVLLDYLANGDSTFARRRDQFAREIDLAAEQGSAVSVEEIDPGIWAVAASVGTETPTIACLSVTGPVSRLEAGTREQVVSLARAAAQEIDEALTTQDDGRSGPG